MPVTDYASFQVLNYHYATQWREQYPTGDHWDAPEGGRARLFGYVHRREMHPLRWWPAAWALRGCRSILEYGAGAAPFAHGLVTAWPFRLPALTVSDTPGLLAAYCVHRFADLPRVTVMEAEASLSHTYDGLVCTEVFEHLPDPFLTATRFMHCAPRIAFDYVDDGHPQRTAVLTLFHAQGHLTGPDPRGLYLWRRR